MIGSHDSYTHLACTDSKFNRYTEFWRCQDTTVLQQYKDGCRFFDVRVKLVVEDGKNHWQAIHGACPLEKKWVSLKSLCAYFNSTLKNSLFRIVLEDSKGQDIFENEVTPLLGKYPGLIEVAIKKPWKTIYWAKNHPQYVEYYYMPWNTGKSFWSNLLSLFGKIDTIKHYAKKHNPVITEEMKNDPNTIYLMDYVSDALNK